MVDVRRSAFNEIPQDWAFDGEKGPFLRQLMDQVEEIRERVGGDNDQVEEYEYALTRSLAREVRSQREEIEQLKDMLAQSKRHTRSVEQKINELTERYDSGT